MIRFKNINKKPPLQKTLTERSERHGCKECGASFAPAFRQKCDKQLTYRPCYKPFYLIFQAIKAIVPVDTKN